MDSVKTVNRLAAAARWILVVPALLLAVLGASILLDREPEERENASYPRRYIALVELYSEKWDVPQSVVYGVMRVESNFRAKAVSPANAIGLMQITEPTYEWVYQMRGMEADPDTIYIPSYNVDAGVYLLAWLYRQYQNWETAFAAYNAGVGRVNRWLEDPEICQDGVLVNIPIEETRNYVRLVTRAAEAYRTLYGME